MNRDWTETDIAALLDGELTGAEAERVARLLETDPAARAVAERIGRNDALLREAFAAPLAEPSPPRLAGLFDAAVTPLPQRPARAASRRNLAMAASAALVVGAVAGALLGPVGEGAGPAAARLAVGAAPPAVAEALSETPSGALRHGVRLIASFAVAGGGHCREFEWRREDDAAPSALGLACRSGGDWRVVVAAEIGEAGASERSGYAPASGVAPDAVSPVLDALGAGPALDPEAEARAIARGWR